MDSQQQTSNIQYVGRQQLISTTGNGKTINLKDCKSKFLLSGHGNIVDITDCHIEINLVGNGNCITLHGTNTIKIGIDGSGNEIAQDESKDQIVVKYDNGFGNILPICSKKSASTHETSEVQKQRNRQAENMATQLRIRKEIMQREEQQRLERLQRRERERRLQYGQDRTRHVEYNGNDSYLITREPPPAFTEGDLNYINRAYDQPPETKHLSTKQFDELPSVKHDGEPVKCSICLDMVQRNDKITYLVCFHCYHTDCIGEWLKKSIKCPVCNLDIKAKLSSASKESNLEYAKQKKY